MRRLTKYLIAILALLLSVSLIFIFSFLWPLDQRIQGTFISDSTETIKEIQRKRKLTERQVVIYSQLLGNMVHTAKGHRLMSRMKAYAVNYSPDGKPQSFDESIVEFFFLQYQKDENQSYLIYWPACDFNISRYEVSLVEFTDDGFWLIDEDWFNGKEKFKRINR